MKKRQWVSGLTLLTGILFLATTVDARTAAYWRHEEGPAGNPVANGPGAIQDSSGNGNTMQTFDNSFTGASYTTTVSPQPLLSGLPNTLSLDFTPNHDNFSDPVSLDSQVFNAMTIELAFNMDAVGNFQTLVGKDGKPTAGPLPPLAAKVRGDDFPNAIPNQFQFEWIDGDGDEVFLASGFTIQPGTWYHVAAVVTATTADLYMATGTGAYLLVDSLSDDFAGTSGEVLIDAPGTWTVGRGMFDGGIADWADAKIDEVRISDMALATNEFLFVPEPSSAVLLALVLAGAVMRRR